jgi:hypothetical protein
MRGVLRGVEAGQVCVQIGDELRRYPPAEIERANLILSLDQFARLGEGLHPLAAAAAPSPHAGGSKPNAARAARPSGESS